MTEPVAKTSAELSIKVVLLLAVAVFINYVDRGNTRHGQSATKG